MKLSSLLKSVDPSDLASVIDGRRHFCIDGGYSLIPVRKPDDCISINDYDCYGKVEWVYCRSQRPAGFDGSAEIIDRERGQVLWWQPYREGRKIYNTSDRLMVKDIVEHGFWCYGIKVYGPAESALGTVTAELCSEYIGGYEPFADHVEVLSQVLEALITQVEKSEQEASK